jgi:hypothetical protein
MSTIGSALPPTSITPSYSPLGKPAVGLESPEAKNQTMPPVEQSTRPDKNRSQPDNQTDPLDADSRRQRERESAPGELSDEELKDVRELAAVDREVRAHEAAHAAVGGSLAGSASFRFITGPDGQQYAVGGEVPISLEVVPQDPAATLRNAQQVQAAALAPANPSAQDISVAAAAAQLVVESQLQLAAQKAAALSPSVGNTESSAADSVRPNTALNAANAFKTAEAGIAPGSLLDQRI